MAKKLKYKLLGIDPVYQENNYQCNLCDEKLSESLQETHALKHGRNTYLVDIDIKKDKTGGKNLLSSV